MTRFGKLKKIIGVYHVKESATAVQCRTEVKCGKMVIMSSERLNEVLRRRCFSPVAMSFASCCCSKTLQKSSTRQKSSVKLGMGSSLECVV